MVGDKHKQLQEKAIEWLYRRRCSVFDTEVTTWNGIADAVGVITKIFKDTGSYTSYYIEAKSSRSDLMCKKQKNCYNKTQEIDDNGKTIKDYSPYNYHDKYNDIDYFYFIIADGIKIDKDLYPTWGVIDERGKVIRRAKQMKKGRDCFELVNNIGHNLVYKVHGKLYLI